jgi:hypothetical protein
VTSLSLYEDLLAPGERLQLPAGARIVYVASGELASLHAGSAASAPTRRFSPPGATARRCCAGS